ncbi:MAG TPA: hypothetical protein VF803_02555, partial [Candidatus Paceibacterota bacterium]
MPKNKTNWAVRASTRVRHALTHVYADSGIVRTARRSLRSATVVGLSMLLLITSAGAAAFADTTVNKTALTAAINAEYSDGAARTTLILQAADYTLASQQAYITTLDAAIAVEASATATQAQVDAATASIAAVKATLVFANQAAMDAAVAAANAKVETDYSTTSWAAFITARTSALALPVATNADEGARLAALDSAMSLLVPIGAAVPVSGVDKSALTAAINAEYSDGAARTTLILQAADYTLASQQAYITTLDAAIAVEASATATQAQVDAATASIAAVKATLVRVTGTATSTSSTASSTAPTTNGVDKTALTAAINGEYLDGALRTTLILQAANYTLASQQAYIGALDAAIAVEANPSATQAQVDAATASIAAVKATLVQVGTVATTTNNTASSTVPVVNGVDKTALTAAINGEYLDGSLRTTLILQAANYTPASQQAYISTLDAAIAVEASTTVTQAQVDAATASIAAVKTTLLTVGGGPAGGTGTTTATSTDTLAQAKIAAHSALTIAQSAYVQANYSPENWLILTAAKSAGDAAIDAATTTDTILSARTVAISAMTAVQTIVEQNNALIALLSSNIATTSLSLSTSTMILSASSTHTSLIIIPQEVIDPQIDL